MSDAHQDHSDAPHEGPIKTPKQLIVAVVLAFVVPIIVIVLLVMYVSAEKKPGAGSDVDHRDYGLDEGDQNLSGLGAHRQQVLGREVVDAGDDADLH